MTLEKAIDNAARDLPGGYLITLSIENGSAWIDLRDENTGYITIALDGSTKTEEISEAVKLAIAREQP